MFKFNNNVQVIDTDSYNRVSEGVSPDFARLLNNEVVEAQIEASGVGYAKGYDSGYDKGWNDSLVNSKAALKVQGIVTLGIVGIVGVVSVFDYLSTKKKKTTDKYVEEQMNKEDDGSM